MNITESNRPEKRLKAIFCKCGKKNACKGSNHKTIHFGQKGSKTYIDGRTKEERENYIARHKVREDFNDPDTAGSLARWILWGPFSSLSKNIQYYKKKFGL